MELTLTVTFTAPDAQQVNSSNLVTALAHNEPDANLICAAFTPFENNTITFSDDWGIFASTDPLTPGSVITLSSTVYPATLGSVYTFADNVFGEPQQGGGEGISIMNNDKRTLTFGLLRGITVNGSQSACPAVAFVANYQGTVVFDPVNSISVFLSDQNNIGAVLTKPAGPVCKIDISTQNKLHFEGAYVLDATTSEFKVG
jgi:hypothetical protein